MMDESIERALSNRPERLVGGPVRIATLDFARNEVDMLVRWTSHLRGRDVPFVVTKRVPDRHVGMQFRVWLKKGPWDPGEFGNRIAVPECLK